MMGIREELLCPRAGGRVLLLLSLVGAVVVGLLCMHTIATTMGEHGEAPSAVMDDHRAMGAPGSEGAAVPDAAALVGDCAGMCGQSHAMAAQACILALLFTGMLLALTRPGSTSLLDRLVGAASRQLAASGTVPSRPPPSLLVLSISRT